MLPEPPSPILFRMMYTSSGFLLWMKRKLVGSWMQVLLVVRIFTSSGGFCGRDSDLLYFTSVDSFDFTGMMLAGLVLA